MNRREAEELLPWFVAGTLDDEEARAVQAFIDNGEISTEALDELRLFSETVSERQASEPVYDPAILERAMSRLDGITQEAPEIPVVVGEVGSDAGAGGRVRGTDETPGLLQRILDALQWSATPPMARVLVAGQFALLFGLAVMVAVGTGETADENEFGVVSGPQTTAVADLSLTFTPGTTEADLRALLLEHHISIVSGPSALGLYQASIPQDADADQVLGALQASPLVLFVQAVPKP